MTAAAQTYSFKKRLFIALDDPRHASTRGKILSGFLAVLILLNALMVFVVFDESLTNEIHLGFYLFSGLSTLVFAAEYFARLWTADLLYKHTSALNARLRYAFSLMGVVDLLAWVPIVAVIAGLIPYQTLNALRVMRVVRLIKVSRYLKGFGVIGRVIEKRRREIIASFAVLLLLTLTSSVLMYQAEHDTQPDAFDSIFTGMYWAMTTITSTGYGDLVPQTALGRLIGFTTMVCSIAIVAIPAGIFTAGFINEMDAEKNARAATSVDAEKGHPVTDSLNPTGHACAEASANKAAHAHTTTSPVQDESRRSECKTTALGAGYQYCPYCGKSLSEENAADNQHC